VSKFNTLFVAQLHTLGLAIDSARRVSTSGGLAEGVIRRNVTRIGGSRCGALRA
jgi:hypothetical protein